MMGIAERIVGLHRAILMLACLCLFLQSCETVWVVKKQPTQLVSVQFDAPVGGELFVDDAPTGTIPCQVSLMSCEVHRVRIDLSREAVTALGAQEQELLLLDMRAKAQEKVTGAKRKSYVTLHGRLEARPAPYPSIVGGNSIDELVFAGLSAGSVTLSVDATRGGSLASQQSAGGSSDRRPTLYGKLSHSEAEAIVVIPSPSYGYENPATEFEPELYDSNLETIASVKGWIFAIGFPLMLLAIAP